jgi:hypothetical protein
MLEELGQTLSHFDRWSTLFPSNKYGALARNIETTCLEVVQFCVETVKFLRRPPAGKVLALVGYSERGGLMKVAVNLLRVLFHSSFEVDFRNRISRIKTQMERAKNEAETAYMEASNDNLAAVREMSKTLLEHVQSPASGCRFPRIIPHVSNPRFFGRDEILYDIHRHLSPLTKSKNQRSYAIYGFVGCGKTQIAIEYTYHSFEYYQAIFWINASNAENIEKSFAEAASILGLENIAMHANEVHQRVLQWLVAQGKLCPISELLLTTLSIQKRNI